MSRPMGCHPPFLLVERENVRRASLRQWLTWDPKSALAVSALVTLEVLRSESPLHQYASQLSWRVHTCLQPHVGPSQNGHAIPPWHDIHSSGPLLMSAQVGLLSFQIAQNMKILRSHQIGRRARAYMMTRNHMSRQDLSEKVSPNEGSMWVVDKPWQERTYKATTWIFNRQDFVARNMS